MPEGLAPFLLTALALVGSPGPNTLSVAATGAAFGRRRGVAYMIGIVLGMLGVIAIVATGVAGMLLALPGAAPVVTVAAAGYFLWLAWRIATAPPLSDSPAGPGAAPRWYEGAGLSMVNPKAYAAMAALFSGHVLLAGPLADAALKTALALGVIIPVNIAWLSLGAGLTGLMRDPATSRWINRAFAAALLISVAAVLL
ncbi:MAG: LysE family translocator [Rhodobacteraceae bacterium]|nr:LysE family translocator [Paracoccaceae bacterium]